MLGQNSTARLLRLRGGASNLTFTPLPGNQPPVANANSYSTAEDTPRTVNAAQGVLTNDTDPENATLTAAIVTQPANGTITLEANGDYLVLTGNVVAK